MYRCEVCLEVSKPGQPVLRHTITRVREPTVRNRKGGEEVAREVVVCPSCHRDAAGGVPLADLFTAHRFTRVSRLEQERERRAARRRAEREALATPHTPLLRTGYKDRAHRGHEEAAGPVQLTVAAGQPSVGTAPRRRALPL